MPCPPIRLHDVREHNLDGVTVEIPHGKLTVVTGVSGSGKSSLIFDTLHAASQRRYLETLSVHARRFLQRLPTPRMRSATGLSPSIALGQRHAGDQARSTVGTLSGMHDVLRFWFARENGLEARDFSFVSAGACADCRGIGSGDEVSRELLIADASRTLRQGALVPTTPTGYIVYSQVTVDALNTVCQAHGFDVDTPWSELTREQHDVVFYGSDRVEVPFGKHSLESRMRWEGITAKPRELGLYKGLIPTIEDILRRSRNENALRFAVSVPCRTCDGSRLGEAARTAQIGGVTIVAAGRWSLPELASWCAKFDCDESTRLQRRLAVYQRLGLSHLSCERAAATLSGGEHQRLRLGAIATGGLAGVTFVFDEPSIGLHASEELAVLDLLADLRDAGNTVVVVEHSEHALRAADYVIDVGPGPGSLGGRVLYSGPPDRLAAEADAGSQTRAHYAEGGEFTGVPLRTRRAVDDVAFLEVCGANANNLNDVDARFALGRLNVVSGVAGAGKSTLVTRVLAEAVRAQIDGRALPKSLRELRHAEGLGQVVHVGQGPIGRTPRSNPATYTGVFDQVRKCFAEVPLAKEQGFKATTFSFNTKDGGRCTMCEGSGREVVGMHGLPAVELTCGECHGRRFREDVLQVRYRAQYSILDVLEATVAEAREIFADEPKILPVLHALHLVGLDHLTLGQPATTLSGGEAQRVRLAGELARGGRKKTLFVLEEPTIGLHRADVAQLLGALDGLVVKGHTVVLVEHDLDVLRAADHLIDMGPGAGAAGGTVCGQGTADEVAGLDTPTGRALRDGVVAVIANRGAPVDAASRIRLRGATTHNLNNVDVDIPSTGFTVVTGVSGSGKSSLVFDTLFGESRARFTEHLSGYVQRQLGAGGARARSLRDADGLRPAIALEQRADGAAGRDLRATVATTGELHPLLRTLWSRIGGEGLAAGAFSFFLREGACLDCTGVGSVERCDASRIVVDIAAPLFEGALDRRNKVVADYADPTMRYRAVIEAVAIARGWDLAQPWAELSADAHRELLHGCGDEEFDAVWQHEGAEGGKPHQWRTKWLGVAGDIDREYARRQQSGAVTRASAFAALLSDQQCPSCAGDRLAEPMRSVQVGGYTLPALCRLTAAELVAVLQGGLATSTRDREVAADTLAEMQRRLARMLELGLGHLQLDRVTSTLSSGERQRLRLARQLASPLTGCVYVLDEPTLGLHARDTDALLQAICGLVAAGNAVVAVEHDMRVLAAADHVLEVGPGAGRLGGELVAAAAPLELPEASRSGRRLRMDAPVARVTPRAHAQDVVAIRGANLNCLKDVDVDLPVGCLTAITGVSGSGKTSLIRGVLFASAQANRLHGCRELTGLDAFASVVEDAGARGRRSRTSCVATELSVFDEIRKMFAATDDARDRGFKAPHFAFLGKNGGACRSCGGLGWVRSEFDFLGADSWTLCEQCSGRRFDDETLSVRWQGMSIADVLDATINELVEELGGAVARKLAAPLRTAQELGLGYLRLGQSADSLSGGEAQRVSLAVHLSRVASAKKAGATLFLLDEPTRGLHPDDIDALLLGFERLLEAGHTIIAIEHDLAVIAWADHVIDLGPDAGVDGGQLVFAGTPHELARCVSSATGQALAATTR
ncbi:MAG: excinuclease ABC subunit A [Planctomycetota bacterium]